YAGVVGCYNGFRTFGIKHGLYHLKPAHECEDREEMEKQLAHITLPSNTKIVMTGYGRVGHGAREIMALLPIKEVGSDSFMNDSFSTPVFTHLDVHQYNRRKADGGFDKGQFFTDPSGYESTFAPYCHVADMYVACHYWAEGAPFLFTREDVKDPKWKVSVVADISCDIDGPVASTLKPSTIADPIYGYNPHTESIDEVMKADNIAVMAVDNLPCELPKDASVDFGNELIKHVLPHLLGKDEQGIIANASETTLDGNLAENFKYLADYVAEAGS
ncbi:MAG: alanine dehydrogenase, partial [Flavobacteriales bacterium]|nr:alanine dehydrogenase [Flavobacteriales bacterium]